MNSTVENNYLEVLQDIEDFYTDNPVDAWCPTTGSTVKLKPLSVQRMAVRPRQPSIQWPISNIKNTNQANMDKIVLCASCWANILSKYNKPLPREIVKVIKPTKITSNNKTSILRNGGISLIRPPG